MRNILAGPEPISSGEEEVESIDWAEDTRQYSWQEKVWKLCGFVQLNLWTLLGCIDIRMCMDDGGSTGEGRGRLSQSIRLSSRGL